MNIIILKRPESQDEQSDTSTATGVLLTGHRSTSPSHRKLYCAENQLNKLPIQEFPGQTIGLGKSVRDSFFNQKSGTVPDVSGQLAPMLMLLHMHTMLYSAIAATAK